MFNIRPQMHRLMKEILDQYGLEIDYILFDGEFEIARDEYYPYYIVAIRPNGFGWTHISLRPHKGRSGYYTKSNNNIVAVALAAQPGLIIGRAVLPSWRGKLVPPAELDKGSYPYYISRGYMPIEVGPDHIENHLIGVRYGHA